MCKSTRTEATRNYIRCKFISQQTHLPHPTRQSLCELALAHMYMHIKHERNPEAVKHQKSYGWFERVQKQEYRKIKMSPARINTISRERSRGESTSVVNKRGGPSTTWRAQESRTTAQVFPLVCARFHRPAANPASRAACPSAPCPTRKSAAHHILRERVRRLPVLPKFGSAPGIRGKC